MLRFLGRLYLSRVKQIVLCFSIFFLACQVPGDKTSAPSQKYSDTLALYLTYDISINGCMLAWESIEQQTLSAGRTGELALYKEAFSDLIPAESRARSFSYIAHDVTDGSEQLVAMESVLFQTIDGGFRLHQVSPFDGTTLICGYIRYDDLLSVIGSKEQSFLRALSTFEQLPRTGKDYSASAMYTASMLLIDTTQKYFASRVEKDKAYSLVDEKLNPMSDSAMRQRVLQYVDSLDGNNKVVPIKQRVSEYDLWKGFMAYGLLGPSNLNWNSFGLLYHPNSKFGGFNPGKILWYAVPTSELYQEDLVLTDFIAMLAQYGVLHSVDPTQYRCSYFRTSSIDIDNGRYPGGRH